MERWRSVFRIGFAPLLTTKGLMALAAGLEQDDPCILQGTTLVPPPLHHLLGHLVEKCCPLCYAAWQGDGVLTVDWVEDSFIRLCNAASNVLGDPRAIRDFINWVDDTPRPVMRRELLGEVNRELAQRGVLAEQAA